MLFDRICNHDLQRRFMLWNGGGFSVNIRYRMICAMQPSQSVLKRQIIMVGIAKQTTTATNVRYTYINTFERIWRTSNMDEYEINQHNISDSHYFISLQESPVQRCTNNKTIENDKSNSRTI